jgi:hypothetical protein
MAIRKVHCCEPPEISMCRKCCCYWDRWDWLFNSIAILMALWGIATIVLLGIYYHQELMFGTLGKIIIAQNIITLIAIFIMIVVVVAGYDPYTDSSVYVWFWMIVWMLDFILFCLSIIMGWIDFAEMCYRYSCFSQHTPLYVLTIISTIFWTCTMIILIVLICVKNCCKECCQRCNETCKWRCFGKTPKWQMPTAVKVEKKEANIV